MDNRLSSDDVARLRSDTPGVRTVAHFNNAGAALPPSAVVDTVVEHIRREAEIGGYEAAAESTGRSDAVYESVAALVGGSAHEVALVDNATRAWDMAVHGFPFSPGDRVLTGRSEYASNAIALLQLRARHGIEIVLIDDDEYGQIDLDQLGSELSRGAAMVALTHVPTNGGLVNPAVEVGDLCRRSGTFFVLDACQSAGQVPLDVDELGCDVLSATSRKYLRGPRGVGFLWVRRGWIDHIRPPLLDLHSAEWTSPDTYHVRSDAKRFETWESSTACRLGMGAAIDYATEVGIGISWDRIQMLGSRLRDVLSCLPGVTVHDKGRVRGGIVSFSVAGHKSAEVGAELTRARINTSLTVPSHARFDGRDLPQMVRASVHYYNTEDEIGSLADVVSEITHSST